MVLLEDEPRRRWLAFSLPVNEANRLARSLNKTPCSYVPVFDLLERLAGAAHLAVQRAELHGDDRGVTAALVFRDRTGSLVLPCHPADALALAVRAGTPIVASDEAMAHAAPADPAVRAAAVRQWLEEIRPSDFGAGEGG